MTSNDVRSLQNAVHGQSLSKLQEASYDIDGDGMVNYDDVGILVGMLDGKTKLEAVRDVKKLYGALPAKTNETSGKFFVNGRLGVGTTLPDERLHIAGNGVFDGTIRAS